MITMCGCHPTKYFTPDDEKEPNHLPVNAEAGRNENPATFDGNNDGNVEGAASNNHRSRFWISVLQQVLKSVDKED